VAKCDVNQLMAGAGCLACSDRGELAVVKTQMLCGWLTNLTPIPPSGGFLLQETGFKILQETGDGILV
jgi:hypothetical protein